MPIRERRDILRSLFTPGSRKYWALESESARVLFVALTVNADDEGRLEGATDDVKALVGRSQWSQELVAGDLEELVAGGLIEQYEIGGRTYIEIVNFVENQSWQGVRSEVSRIPANPHGSRSATTVETQPFSGRSASAPKEIPTYQENSREEKSSATTATKEEPAECADSEGAECAPSDPDAAYREARRLCRRYVGKSIGSLGPKAHEWNGLVNRHGTERIVKAVELWARDTGKRGRTLGWPLAVFMKQANQWIEEVGMETLPDDGEEEVSRVAGPRGVSPENMR